MGYHEYHACEGYHESHGAGGGTILCNLSTVGDIIMHVRDIMSNVGCSVPSSTSHKNRQELDFKRPDIHFQNGPQNTEIQGNKELKTLETTLSTPPC